MAVVTFRFVSHSSSLTIGFIGYCESEKTREVYVCMTLQICQRARRRVGGRVGEEEISHCACVLPVGKYRLFAFPERSSRWAKRAKLPCKFGKLLAAGMLLRDGATSASPRVLVPALLRVALEGPRAFTLLFSEAHVGGR